MLLHSYDGLPASATVKGRSTKGRSEYGKKGGGVTRLVYMVMPSTGERG